ncbi:hypothetical protein D3C84_1262470 [compost metagenome]
MASASLIARSTYSRVASTTAGSIFSTMFAELLTMKFIRTTWVLPLPWSSNGL